MAKIFDRADKTPEFTADEIEILEKREVVSDELHLDIESFYLFAKIFLDKVARFIEHYFGAQVPRRPLDSHDDLVKNLEAYRASKDLSLPEALISTAAELKAKIADHRDYHISHEKSPRTVHGIQITSEGWTKLVLIRINPKGSEANGISTDVLGDLLARVDDTISYTSNRSRSTTSAGINPTKARVLQQLTQNT